MNFATLAQRPPTGVSPSVVEFLKLDFRNGVYQLAEETLPLSDIVEGIDEGSINPEDGYPIFDPSAMEHAVWATAATRKVLKSAIAQGCTILFEFASDSIEYCPILTFTDSTGMRLRVSRDNFGGENGLVALTRIQNSLQQHFEGPELIEPGRNKFAWNVNVLAGSSRTSGVSTNGATSTYETQTDPSTIPGLDRVVFFSENFEGLESGADTLDANIYSITIRRPIAYADLPAYSIPVDWTEGDAPVIYKVPVLGGSTSVGDIMTVTPGTWVGYPTITYQWYRDGDAISGADQATYEIVADDLGTVLSVEEIATNTGGSTPYELTAPAPVTTAAAVRYTLFSPGTDLRATNEKNTLTEWTEAGWPLPEVASAALCNRGYRSGKYYLEWHVHNIVYSSGMMNNFVGLANSDFNLASVNPETMEWQTDPHAQDKVITWSCGYPGFPDNTPGRIHFNGAAIQDVHTWWQVSDYQSAPITQILQMAVEFVDGTDDVKLWTRGMTATGTPGDWNEDPSADPATGAGAITITIGGGNLRPITRLISNGATTANKSSISTFFKAEDFVGTIPSGFSAWSEEVTGTAATNEKTRRIIQGMYAGTAPDAARRVIIDDLVGDIGSTIFGKMENFLVVAAHDRFASVFDWASIRKINDYADSEGDRPIFVPDRGSTGRGDSVHNYELYRDGAVLTQTSAHNAIWSLTDTAHPDGGSTRAYEFGSSNSSIARVASGGIRVSCNSAEVNFTGTSIKGYTAAVRPSSVNWSLYKGTVSASTVALVTTTTAGTSTSQVPGETAFIHSADSSKAGVNQIAFAHRGSALTSIELDQIYSALRAYAIAVGIDPDA